MARTMTNVLQIVHSVFSTAIKASYPGFSPAKGIVQSSGSGGKFGDYKCMAAMPIAQVRHGGVSLRDKTAPLSTFCPPPTRKLNRNL